MGGYNRPLHARDPKKPHTQKKERNNDMMAEKTHEHVNILFVIFMDMILRHI